MDESPRIDWYRKLQTLALVSKLKLDEAEYSEIGPSSVAQETCEQDHFTPWWLLFQDGLRAGRSTPEVASCWLNDVEKPGSHAIKVRGEWLVPRFMGVFLNAKKVDSVGSETRRRKPVDSTEQLRELHAGGQQMLDGCLVKYQRPSASVGDVSSMPHVQKEDSEDVVITSPSDPVVCVAHREACLPI